MTKPKNAGKTIASAPATKPARTPARLPVKKLAGPSTKPGKAAAPVVTPSASGKPRHKLVRDSFTIPKSEYAMLDALKLRAANLERPTKKSEVLRAGIVALAKLGDKAFLAALESVPVLKTGRPQKTLPAKS